MSGIQQELMAGTGAGGGSTVSISNSLMLDSTTSQYMSRTFGTPTLSAAFTMSMWVKRGMITTATYQAWLGTSSSTTVIGFNTSADNLMHNMAGTTATSSAMFRDPASWYHFVYQYSGTTYTIYCNGVVVLTGTATNTQINIASKVTLIGAFYSVTPQGFFDGYLADVKFVDGQALLPTSFAHTSTSTGLWVPSTYSGTYGANGFWLKFDNASALGTDASGNGNNWALNGGISSANSYADTPTNNYAVLNPINPNPTAPSLGNTRVVVAGSENGYKSTIATPAGVKAYAEYKFLTTTAPSYTVYAGVCSSSVDLKVSASYNKVGVWDLIALAYQQLYANGSIFGSQLVSHILNTSTIQVAIDNSGSSSLIWIGIDNAWYNSALGTTGNPATGANPTFTISKQDLHFYMSGYVNTITLNFGAQSFVRTPPTGFVALCTANLPTSTITKPYQYFDVVTYTGTGSSKTVTMPLGTFTPDLTWIRNRNTTTSSKITDSVRGVTKGWISSSTAVDSTDTNGLTAFGAGTFTVGSDTNYNANGNTYVAWNWLAGGAPSAGTGTGGITSVSTSANVTARFSISTMTLGVISTTGTFTHGLGLSPDLVIVRIDNNNGSHHYVFHSAMSAGNNCYLDTAAAQAALAGISSVSSTTVSLGTLLSNLGTATVYCWAAVAGYSAFGRYVGNASTDGTFVYCDLRPRFGMTKCISTTDSWVMFDALRPGYNPEGGQVWADLTTAEATTATLDILSNGFKCRLTTTPNAAQTYVYAVWAEAPFPDSNAR